MRPITFSSNKHFIPLANKPLIYYPVETVVAAGIKDIGITYNPGGLTEAKAILGDGSKWGVNFTFILQPEPKGLANIVEVAEEFIAGDSFVFHLGDNIFENGIRDLVDFFTKNKPNGLLSIMHHPDNIRMGVPYFDKQGKITKLVEKPKNPPHDFAIPGVYIADANIFKCFKGKEHIKPSARGEYEILDAFQWLIDHGYKVDAREYQGKWLDPGKFDDWLETNRYILDQTLVTKLDSKPVNTIIENRVKIGKKCKIVNSEIRGPVIIGDNVSIVDSYIGPYTAIADDSAIEKSRVENSVLMKGVAISSIERPIDASVIGAHAEISHDSNLAAPMKLYIGELSKIIL